MNTAEKLDRLSNLSEAEFRANLLIPLLRKMQYADVRERHGTAEYGKDITFSEETPLGNTYYAIVAKVGDISGSASGKQNLAIVKEQVSQAFSIPYPDLDNKRKQAVNHVIVWTSGKISNSAETQVIDSLSSEYRNVSFKDGQATVELVDKYFPTYFTVGDIFASDYYTMAKDFYGRIEELRTLGTSSDRFRLPVIFVPPVLVQYLPRRKELRTDAQRFSVADILTRKGNFHIVGQMGAGKSTLLRRLLLATIEKNEISGSTSPMPILIPAKRLDPTRPDCIEAALADEVARLSTVSENRDLLTNALDTSALVLVDGVDELRDEALILGGFECIAEFAKKYPETKIISSSRKTEVLENLESLSSFTMLELEELTPKQVNSFVQNWFGPDNPITNQLSRFLHDPLNLKGLPSTPLTLAIVAILYSNGVRELPANLTELFSKYTELALGRWDEGRDISQQFEWRVKQFLIRGIAWTLHQNHTSVISHANFDETISLTGNDRGLRIDASAFREEVVDRSELIVTNLDGDYEFKHRAFQDYFAALEISSHAGAIDLIVENFLDPWWEQAIFFACGLHPESADFLNKIMSTVKPTAQDTFRFAVNLGLATQASYLAPRAVKAASVLMVIDALRDAYSGMEKLLEDTPDKLELPSNIPLDLFLVPLIMSAARQALGSISLADVIAEITREHIAATMENFSEEKRDAVEWKSFLLAVASASADNVKEFSDLIESPLINQMMFRVFCSYLAKELETHSWLTSDAISRIERLRKKLLKSVRMDTKSIPEPLRRKAVSKLQAGHPSKGKK